MVQIISCSTRLIIDRTVIDNGDFWLSNTPTIPSTYPRPEISHNCTWAKLPNSRKTNKFTTGIYGIFEGIK